MHDFEEHPESDGKLARMPSTTWAACSRPTPCTFCTLKIMRFMTVNLTVKHIVTLIACIATTTEIKKIITMHHHLTLMVMSTPNQVNRV